VDVVIEHHFEVWHAFFSTFRVSEYQLFNLRYGLVPQLLKQFLGISFLSRECSSPASLWESQIYPGSRGLPLVVRSKGLCGNNTVWLSNSNMYISAICLIFLYFSTAVSRHVLFFNLVILDSNAGLFIGER
jgi:hypothetical protein